MIPLSDPVLGVEELYRNWSSMRLVTFSLSSGEVVKRHVESHGNSVCVLPYDPSRKCALLISMLRAPVMLAGGEPILEVPAGRQEIDELPAETVRREAQEEVGVLLTDLTHVMDAWSLPAISSERSSMFLGAYASTDRVHMGGGLASEGEEMIVHEIPLASLWQLYKAKRLPDLKTAFLLVALQELNPELFA